MTRIAWWMVESLSRLLDGDEREVVRGDLAECGTSPAQALRAAQLCNTLVGRDLRNRHFDLLALLGLFLPRSPGLAA